MKTLIELTLDICFIQGSTFQVDLEDEEEYYEADAEWRV